MPLVIILILWGLGMIYGSVKCRMVYGPMPAKASDNEVYGRAAYTVFGIFVAISDGCKAIARAYQTHVQDRLDNKSDYHVEINKAKEALRELNKLPRDQREDDETSQRITELEQKIAELRALPAKSAAIRAMEDAAQALRVANDTTADAAEVNEATRTALGN